MATMACWNEAGALLSIAAGELDRLPQRRLLRTRSFRNIKRRSTRVASHAAGKAAFTLWIPIKGGRPLARTLPFHRRLRNARSVHCIRWLAPLDRADVSRGSSTKPLSIILRGNAPISTEWVPTSYSEKRFPMRCNCPKGQLRWAGAKLC
jgi:hypothetical protein